MCVGGRDMVGRLPVFALFLGVLHLGFVFLKEFNPDSTEFRNKVYYNKPIYGWRA